MNKIEINSVVISLADAYERRTAFLSNNKKLTFKFFDAVDLRKKKVPFLKPSSKIFINNDFNLGALGCLISHRKILKSFVHGKDDYISVFEDDIIVKYDKYKVLLDNICKLGNFDILFMGSNNGHSYSIDFIS